jgi:hypothetical protein
MVQIQTPQHFLEQLFLPAFEPVPRQRRLGVAAPLPSGCKKLHPPVQPSKRWLTFRGAKTFANDLASDFDAGIIHSLFTY